MPYTAEHRIPDIAQGEWTIKQMDHGSYVEFEIHEGNTWKDSDVPRSTLDVTVWKPRSSYGGKMAGCEISWPSTSDKRPVLARALAVALELAADYADTWVENPEGEFVQIVTPEEFASVAVRTEKED